MKDFLLKELKLNPNLFLSIDVVDNTNYVIAGKLLDVFDRCILLEVFVKNNKTLKSMISFSYIRVCILYENFEQWNEFQKLEVKLSDY